MAAAHERGLELQLPTRTTEDPGPGISGEVDGRRVALGRLAWLTGSLGIEPDRELDRELELSAAGAAAVSVAVDGRLAGAIELADPVREDAAEMLASLRAAGVDRLVLVTGDDRPVAEQIAASVGVDAVFADWQSGGKA